MKTYFVIEIEWSATDKSVVIVKAATKEKALHYVKTSHPSARYISVIREAEVLTEIL